MNSIDFVEKDKLSVISIASKERYIITEYFEIEEHLDKVSIDQNYNSTNNILAVTKQLDLEYFVEWTDFGDIELDLTISYFPIHVRVGKERVYVFQVNTNKPESFLTIFSIDSGDVVNEIKLAIPMVKDIFLPLNEEYLLATLETAELLRIDLMNLEQSLLPLNDIPTYFAQDQNYFYLAYEDKAYIDVYQIDNINKVYRLKLGSPNVRSIKVMDGYLGVLMSVPTNSNSRIADSLIQIYQIDDMNLEYEINLHGKKSISILDFVWKFK